jgi:hypothetical protein
MGKRYGRLGGANHFPGRPSQQAPFPYKMGACCFTRCLK